MRLADNAEIDARRLNPFLVDLSAHPPQPHYDHTIKFANAQIRNDPIILIFVL